MGCLAWSAGGGLVLGRGFGPDGKAFAGDMASSQCGDPKRKKLFGALPWGVRGGGGLHSALLHSIFFVSIITLQAGFGVSGLGGLVRVECVGWK